ncbi:Uncharacterised protein [Mycobacteroides abscessus subsp. abscessus]|nr:Uncharacterised protein [Mycobacteroides abscessus subsp. abscessus]
MWTCLLIAAYPIAKRMRTTPRTRNDSGIPSSPVTAKLLGTPPATTVSGAEAAMIMKTREAVPIRRPSRLAEVGVVSVRCPISALM